MKNTLFLLLALGLFSCGDLELSEKIIARSQLDTLTNYNVHSLYATENEAYINVSRSIFDKSQILNNCVRPLKVVSEGLLFKNQVFSNSSNTIPSVYGLKRAGENYFRVNEDYSNGSRKFVVEEFALNYELKAKRAFDFIGKIKGAYESIYLGRTLYLGANEYAVTYATDNYNKTLNAMLYIGFTNGNNLSDIYSYEFKNRTSCSVVGMIIGSNENPYILVRTSSKTESNFVLLKFDIVKRVFTIEKDFVLKDVYLYKIDKINSDTFVFYHGQDYLTKPNVYLYSLTTKEITTKSIDFSKVEKDFTYSIPEVTYDGERFLLYFLKSESKALIAELTKDLKVNPIFAKKEVYSIYKVTDSSEESFVLYEVSNSKSNSKGEIIFYRHTSLSDLFQKTLFSKHAGLNECYKFD